MTYYLSFPPCWYSTSERVPACCHWAGLLLPHNCTSDPLACTINWLTSAKMVCFHVTRYELCVLISCEMSLYAVVMCAWGDRGLWCIDSTKIICSLGHRDNRKYWEYLQKLNTTIKSSISYKLFSLLSLFITFIQLQTFPFWETARSSSSHHSSPDLSPRTLICTSSLRC